MQRTFAEATFVIGEGEARRTGIARDVQLTVTIAPPAADAARGGSPFLNGQISALGTFLEECRPNSSLLAVGRETALKLGDKERWSLVNILIVGLGPIQSPEKGQRLYPWSFLVTGAARDALGLFSEQGLS